MKKKSRFDTRLVVRAVATGGIFQIHVVAFPFITSSSEEKKKKEKRPNTVKFEPDRDDDRRGNAVDRGRKAHLHAGHAQPGPRASGACFSKRVRGAAAKQVRHTQRFPGPPASSSSSRPPRTYYSYWMSACATWPEASSRVRILPATWRRGIGPSTDDQEQLVV